MKLLNLISIIFIFAFTTYGQEVWLHPNKGQWDEEIEYSVELNNGYLYVDNQGFTFFLNNALSHDHDGEKHVGAKEISCHVIKSHFKNSNWKGQKIEEEFSTFYRNYFLDKDSSKWKSQVSSVNKTTLIDFYPGIDLMIKGESSKLKYTFLVEPGKDASVIEYEIEGSDKIYLKDGALHYSTRFGEIIEEKPIAWTEKDGRKKEVEVEFILKGNKAEFVFPKGYDKSATLYIDPYLVFSSFSGSTLDNWGMTATPDLLGNLHGGGIVFAATGNYPTTTGAFDVTFNGGNAYTYTFSGGTYNMSGFDIAISKFNSNGSALLYSTYLGGTGNDAPHSLVCDENNNLYVFGVTGSADFPVTSGCYDGTFNGGPFVAENELGYFGSDLYVTRFNSTGTSLVGSTFVGGSGTDGINIGALNYNYGDPFRGEIIAKNGFVYVSSTSQSTDFPTLGAAQGSLNGAQDAVIFKMNTALTNMAWSTYFGGSGSETGNSVQLSSTGNVYVAGGSNSSTLPLSVGEDLSFNGVSDGYLLKIQGGSSLFISGTFIGMSEYDQAYFVQLDNTNNVYVYGQSESSWPITGGLYGNPNSGQFIRKYNNQLTTTLWTTMIGAGTGHPEISPTAFLVSDCGDIYISGWGGYVNSSNGNQAIYSSTNGFPVTPDAYQSTTNGSNFYIAVLSQNAASLKYATFMGGASSSYNHVDGGTSRFDKSGRIYHAVCGACGGQDFGFTSTPGVWSQTNQSSNCNLAAFKFELSTITAVVSEPEPLICLPDPVIFNNNSANGNNFDWDFGDGTGSTEVNPTHVYSGPGQYTVTLVVSDSAGCFTSDTVEFDVNIGDFQGGVVTPPSAICPGQPYQLEAHGGAFYSWTPAEVLDDPSSPTPTATVFETTDFTVVISDSCGVDTLELTLDVFSVTPTISNDTSVCIGGNVTIAATGGGTYLWSPPASLSNPNIANPVATPTTSTTYYVEITSTNGCNYEDSVTVDVFFDPPVSQMPDVLEICQGMSTTVNVSGADDYYWSPNYRIDTLQGQSVVVNPENDFTYYCDFVNACGSVVDSVFIDVVSPDIVASNDSIVCPGETVPLSATGGVSYQWYPETGLDITYSSNVNSTPPYPITYFVIGTDANGCQDSDSVYVDLFPQPFIQTSPDVNLIYGDQVMLSATSTTPGVYVWDPAEYLSCVSCPNPIASPSHNMVFTVSYVDENGCAASDQVQITFDPIIYVPNTFTPNDDESNQGFRIVAHNIESFELFIFNRWGELIYTMTSLTDFWDGTYEGLPCQDGTYVWKMNYIDFEGIKHELAGHINLIR